jgi:hypothetical protein
VDRACPDRCDPARGWWSSSSGSPGRCAILEVLRAAEELQRYCRSREWRFCFIGGIGLLRWGEPRLTIDADLTLLAGFGNEAPFVDGLLEHFQGRVADPRGFALEHRVVLLRSPSGVGLDVALGGLPFEASAVDRASDFDFPDGITLRTCSAEDLIVMKAFASRGRDWVDLEAVLVRQGPSLDWAYVRRHLVPLAELKGEPDIVARLESLRIRLDR